MIRQPEENHGFGFGARFRIALVALAGMILSACAAPHGEGDRPTVTRLLDPHGPAAVAEPLPGAVGAPLVHVTEIEVRVPRSLKVSERNSYLPGGDIVWHGDPPGDRHAQVAAVVLEGLQDGVRDLDGPRGVRLLVEVTRFHALTPKARYTFGGVHAIQFRLTVLDSETGETLVADRFVKADFRALGGEAALAAEARGLTQKRRIVDHLARVIHDELTLPEGHAGEKTGLIGVLNQI